MRVTVLDKELKLRAERALAAAPASLEMPAGTGKTHLLAAVAAMATANEQRCLVLTHTNAGVDALRKRLRAFGVSPSMVVVDTIASWAFTLVRSYPELAGISVPSTPDWSKSGAYLTGAIKVAAADAVKQVHRASFQLLLVDEYQDCSMSQHDFILNLHKAVPQALVFGDRLQGIFGFDPEDPLVDWESSVFPSFPLLDMDHVPHRWREHNQDLGQWILEVRGGLTDGAIVDWSQMQVPGLAWVDSRHTGLAEIAYAFRNFDESVVLLDKWAGDVANHASRLGGAYTVMEDIQGRFMHEELQSLARLSTTDYAFWLASFAKKCFTGLAGIDQPVLRRLKTGSVASELKRDGIERILVSLDELRAKPSLALLVATAGAFEHTQGVRIYRREAWRDAISALSAASASSNSPADELSMIRDRARRVGRRAHARVASRTLLVKGLEYDHVIIANGDKFNDPENLYVALSRARKSVTILSSRPSMILSR